MAHIFWTTDLATGLRDIDEQHQQMLSYFNNLSDAHEKNNHELTNITLFDLISCTMSHFAYEEEMLAQSGYHLLDTRKRMHQNFVEKLVEFQSKIMENPSVASELLTMLEGWLPRHIRINDFGYLENVLQSGIYQQNDDGTYSRIGAENHIASAPQAETPSENQEIQETHDTPAEPNPSELDEWQKTQEILDVTTEVAAVIGQLDADESTQAQIQQSIWEKLVAKHEQNQAQNAETPSEPTPETPAQATQSTEDEKPRGWASSF